jgi:ribosomal protein L30E
MKRKKCSKCGTDYPVTTEYFYSDKDRLTSACKFCQRKNDAIRRAEGRKRNVERTPENIKRAASYMLKHKYKRKEQLVEIKLTVGCQICGYNYYSGALHFHHHIGTKKYDIGTICGRSVATIQTELCKCIVLCSNCHAEVHAKLQDVSSLPVLSEEQTQIIQ